MRTQLFSLSTSTPLMTLSLLALLAATAVGCSKAVQDDHPPEPK